MRPGQSVHPFGPLVLVALVLIPLKALAGTDNSLEKTAFSSAGVAAAGEHVMLGATLGELGVVGQSIGGNHRLSMGFWSSGGTLLDVGPSDDPALLPGAHAARSPLPNPFRGGAEIAYSLAGTAPVRMVVYDVTGSMVSTVVDRKLGPGWYRARWDGRDDSGLRVASGMYYLQIRIGTYTRNQKLLKIE